MPATGSQKRLKNSNIAGNYDVEPAIFRNIALLTRSWQFRGSSGSEARLGWVLHTPPHVWAETSCYQTIERQGLSFLTEIGEKCKHFFFFYFNLHFCLTLLDENWHPHTNIFGCPLEIPTMYKINYLENPTRH